MVFMEATVVVGLQWGDEGKGKIIDYLSKGADWVARFQGGTNAGHTVIVGNEKYKHHLIPSGALHGKRLVVGNGMVVDPKRLIAEIAELKEKGVKVNLTISERASVVMPYHRMIEDAEEQHRGGAKIGTTKQGIGPCYSDKIARYGIKFSDLIDPQTLLERLKFIVPIKQKSLEAYGSTFVIDLNEIYKEFATYGEKLKPMVANTSVMLNEALDKNESVLLEGAQGTYLDIDFGTYPYTTSSNTCSGNACIGSGVGPKRIGKIIGITKAYTTRVGKGPFPTELHDEVGEHLVQKGKEFGTTTGRRRRCGWLDLVMIKDACRLSSVTSFVLTKLDVLTGLKEIKICTKYFDGNKTVNHFPASLKQLERVRPAYKTFKGWGYLSKKYEEFPEEAKMYLSFIQKELSIPTELLSIGPGREQTVVLKGLKKQ